MKLIERLHLRAIRLATELKNTTKQLESMCYAEANKDTQENVAHIAVLAEDVCDALVASPVILER